MRFVFLAGSPRATSTTRRLARLAHDHALRAHGEHEHDWLDLHQARVMPFRGFEEEYDEATREAARCLAECDGLFIASPVYNGGYAAAIKNVFEFVQQKDMEGSVAALAFTAGSARGLMHARSQLDSLLTYFLMTVIPRPVYALRSELEGGVPEEVAERTRALVDELVRVTVALRGAPVEAARPDLPSQRTAEQS